MLFGHSWGRILFGERSCDMCGKVQYFDGKTMEWRYKDAETRTESKD